MSNPPFVTEADLAKELGVARELLAQVRTRALCEGPDWQKQKNAVALTPAGVEKIRAALAAPTQLDGSNPSPEEKGAPQTVYVRRAARQNVRVLFAADKKEAVENEEQLVVRVRDNRCFTPGQEITIRADDAGVWHLHGRQPKGRGKHRLQPRGIRR